MSHVISFLSGEVPGGIILLFFALLIVNLVLIFARSSKLISVQESKKKQLYASLLIIILYVLPWIFLQPPQPVKRIVILPLMSKDASQKIDASAFAFSDFAQDQARGNLSDKYILHRWQWLYRTIGKDSARFYSAWLEMAHRLNPAVIILPERQKDKYLCSVILVRDGEKEEKTYTVSKGCEKLLAKINEDFRLFEINPQSREGKSQLFLEARLAILQDEFDLALKILQQQSSAEADVLRGEIHARKGLLKKIDRARAEYVPQEIEEFKIARKYLARVIRDKEDTPDVAYWLGRMALHVQDYTKAEIYLKNALIGDPGNSRIYQRLFYLHPGRLAELGYKNRVDALAKAVYFDPGFKLAVQELAEEYFLSGSGAKSGKETGLAKQVLEDYLKLKKDDPQILALMASLYLKTSEYDKAYAIYIQLYKRFPDDSNSSYNLGAVHFIKKEYPKALEYFLRAIKIDKNLDAYLYAGITYQRMEKNALALEYYRKRVRMKTGDDDYYAKEAMKGIRAILADSLNGAKNEVQSDLPQSAAKNQ